MNVDGNMDVEGKLDIDGDLEVGGELTIADLAITGELTGPGELVNGKYVGEIFMIPGRVKAPSADFPALCLTNIDIFTDIDAANFPNLVTELRAETGVFLDGLTGETEDFPGNASGSVITLTDTTANNALLAILIEHAAAFGDDYDSLGVVRFGGADFPITDINSITRAITVTGTPTAGAGDATFFPHRIAGSTTTARVQSWRGRSPVGANGAEGGTVSGYVRRDQMQRITGSQGETSRLATDLKLWEGAFIEGTSTGQLSAAAPGTGNTTSFNSAGSPDARASATTGEPNATHPSDVSTHIYQFGGTYVS
jgi:hypothetical protein